MKIHSDVYYRLDFQEADSEMEMSMEEALFGSALEIDIYGGEEGKSERMREKLSCNVISEKPWLWVCSGFTKGMAL